MLKNFLYHLHRCQFQVNVDKTHIFYGLGFEDDHDYNQDCLFYNFQLLLSWNFFPRESVQSSFLSVCDFISLLQVAPVFFLEIAKHPSYKKLITGGRDHELSRLADMT